MRTIKKLILLFILLYPVLYPVVLLSDGFKIDSTILDMDGIISMDKYRNNIAVLGDMGYNHPLPYQLQVCVFDGKFWTYLPNYCTGSVQGAISPITEPLMCSWYSELHYDSTGAIWVSGYRCMYQYKNGQWRKFYIDDTLQDYRTYESFTVDKNNNLWVETSGWNSSKRIFFSELLKFDGDNFQIIKKYKSPYAFRTAGGSCFSEELIVTLPDNRILIFVQGLHDLDEYGNPILDDIANLYYFNQDYTYTKELLQSASTPYMAPLYDTLDKSLYQIYPENENKIWFALNNYSQNNYWADGGIVLRENGTWIPFTEANGLVRKNYQFNPVYEAIHKIIKFSGNQYLAFGDERIYTFLEDDYQLKEIPKDTILNNSRYIHSKFVAYDDNKLPKPIDYKYVAHLLSYPCAAKNLLLNENGELWVSLSVGILIFNTNFLTTSIKKDQDKNQGIYPNPTFTEINISKEFEYSSYKIYNIYGSIVQECINQNNSININDLPPSMYFIEFYRNNQFLSAHKFIKM